MALELPSAASRSRQLAADHAGRACNENARHRFFASALNKALSSALATTPAKLSNLPCSAISRAARMTAFQATRASVPPTLIRRTPNAAISLTREAARARHQEIDRLGRDRLHHRHDLLARLDAGRIEAVGAGIGKGLEPADGLVKIGPAAHEAFGARREHDVAAGLVDCGARGAHARERKVEIIERICRIAGRILDREPGDAGLDAEPHVLGNVLRSCAHSRPRNRH